MTVHIITKTQCENTHLLNYAWISLGSVDMDICMSVCTSVYMSICWSVFMCDCLHFILKGSRQLDVRNSLVSCQTIVRQPSDIRQVFIKIEPIGLFSLVQKDLILQ